MKHRSSHRQPDPSAPRRLWNHKGGNIALITALTMIPLTFAMGMAFDYTLSRSRQDQLDGIADAAALGAVTPAMMGKSPTVAQTQATNLFNGQAANVSGAISVVPVVTPTDTVSGTTVTRTVTVTYTAKSQNVFAALLGMPTLSIGGTSTAKSTTAPNINFYMLLDTSPSMEIAATSTGIQQLEALTTAQQTTSTPKGCAFGCHETNPSGSDVAGNPGGEDNYTLAHNNGINLRIDLVKAATQSLMSSAQTAATQNGATYKAALYTFDVNFNTLQTLTSLSAAGTAAGNIAPLTIYSNNYLTSSNANQDEDTNIDSALSTANLTTNLPNPGGGTNNKGDTPQEVLFIVTDGMNDYNVGSGGNCGSSTRSCVPMDLSGSLCTAIKNRGIRIAVLYTVYYPLDSDPVGGQTWYDLYIDPMSGSGPAPGAPLPQVAAAAQACASPGLFYAVSTDGDITTALENLFQEAVATARLTN
jgi:Flp pilus assembly protein TadG